MRARTSRTISCIGILAVLMGLVAGPAQAGHSDAHALIKYWNVGGDPTIRAFDPHETIEDLQGVTGHVATPSAPLTLVTSMENTVGGSCGPLYWNPVTNDFKTYAVTGGLQVAIDVNREAPTIANGSTTFEPGDTWMTVYGSSSYPIYVNHKNSDTFRIFSGFTSSAVGLRVNQSNGKVYAGAFDDGAIVELNPATNAVRKWVIGSRPYWVDIDSAGRVYTAAAAGSGEPDQVVRLTPATGEVVRWNLPGGGLQSNVGFGLPNGVRIDPQDNFWVSQTTTDKVARLRVSANAIDQFSRAPMDDPEGIAASGAGSATQAFFTERASSSIGLVTPASGAPVTTSVTPAISTVTPTASIASVTDRVITPVRATIPPMTFDSAGTTAVGITRFPAPPGVSGPAGISRVTEPGTIYGTFEGSDHVFRVESAAIIAPVGSCLEGPSISVSITRPATGRKYENNVDVGSSGSSAIIVRGSPLRLEAVSSNPANTAAVDFFIDNGLVGTATSLTALPTPHYEVTTPTLLSGGSHTIRVRARQLDRPSCAAEATVPIQYECFATGLVIDKPQDGRIYNNNVDIGPSGGDTLAIGGPLDVTATSSNVPQTANVSFAVDAGTPVIDTTGVLTTPPAGRYETTVDTSSLSPGLHVITVKLTEINPQCTLTRTIRLRIPDPAVKGVAKGFYAAINIPTEPQVHAGGASIGRNGGSDFIRIVDQPVTPVVDYLHVITDRSEGSDGSPFYAESDSLITDVSLLGGSIKADVLHARARADLDLNTGTASASGADSEIVRLTIGGVPIVVSQPNTVIPLPNGLGYVIVQETLLTQTGARAEVTVNMIHAFLDSSSQKGEVIVGSAYAGVNLSTDLFTGPDTDLIHRIDDAGTDTDAGDTRAGAIPIAPGIYSGSMTTGDSSDFYSFPSGQGERIVGVMKPAERTIVRENPVPTGPPPLTAFEIIGYVLDVVAATSIVGPDLPDFDLYLYDPTGNLRARGPGITAIPTAPERAEINADTPYDPPGARDTWTLEVRRVNAVDGFYSLELSLLPEPLLDQNDALIPGDAPGSCGAPRVLPPTQTRPQEVDDYAFPGVIRDDDRADFFSFDATIGQLITGVLKPDELDDGADLDLYLYGPSSPGGATDCSAPIAASTLGKELAKGLPDAVLDLPATVTGPYVLEVRRFNGVANYYVNLNVTNPLPTVPDNDAGTGADAGNTCVTATTVPTGAHQGRFPDLPTIDNEDWYAFDVQAGQDITVVMKPSEASNFDLDLFDANCAIVPPDQYTVNHQILSVPETVHASNVAAGSYKIRVHRVLGGGNYMTGIVLSP